MNRSRVKDRREPGGLQRDRPVADHSVCPSVLWEGSVRQWYRQSAIDAVVFICLRDGRGDEHRGAGASRAYEHYGPGLFELVKISEDILCGC